MATREVRRQAWELSPAEVAASDAVTRDTQVAVETSPSALLAVTQAEDRWLLVAGAARLWVAGLAGPVG